MGQAKLILAIDDDADFREGLTDVLDEFGYRVRTAANGREALEALRTEPAPDVILLDLRMPEMDGRTFRREQARDEKLSGIPLVVVSGSLEVDEEAESLGASAVLPKPFGVDELLKSIETVIQH
ncbi:MAG TPA: response regulator [Thermoanaerobaculia bacterium]|nr:response regulator [Thermoanaerobaculia bacterium]